jgi:hypothetical protein
VIHLFTSLAGLTDAACCIGLNRQAIEPPGRKRQYDGCNDAYSDDGAVAYTAGNNAAAIAQLPPANKTNVATGLQGGERYG